MHQALNLNKIARALVIVLFLLVIIVPRNVSADSVEEFQGCMQSCLPGDDYEDSQFQQCTNTCKGQFPIGYKTLQDRIDRSSLDREINNNPNNGSNGQGQETSATCYKKDPNSQACHGTCIPKDQLCLNVPIAGKNTFPSFQEYFQTIYSFILGAVAILSTVMIMWGGFKWLTSRGGSGEIGEAKKIITSSIIGLVLAFLSFTILYLVNPKLTVIGLPQLKTVNLEVNEAKLTPLTTQNYQHPTTAPGKWNSGTYTQDEQAVRTALTGPDIGATIQGNNPPCVDSNGNQISYQSYLAQNNNNHCTTLASLPNTAIEGLKKIRSSCPNCELEITGGTELGHDEHGAGRAVVDLDTNGVLDVYINKFPVENGRHTLPGGGTALNEGDHWHLEY